MTAAVRGSFLECENGSISDHLRTHVHLTNCIHLKNHMHAHNPLLADRSLIRDLIALQSSNSLRDPSTSPPASFSRSTVDSSSKRGRRSSGFGNQREHERLLGNTWPVASLAKSRVAVEEVLEKKHSETGSSDVLSTGRVPDSRRNEDETRSRENRKSSVPSGSEKPLLSGCKSALINDFVSRKVETDNKKIPLKGNHGKEVHSEQLKELLGVKAYIGSSLFHTYGSHTREEKTREERETRFHGYCNGLNQVKKHKLRGTSGNEVSAGLKDVGANNLLSVASNSLYQGSAHQSYYVKEEEGEEAQPEVTWFPRNGYGIPWNWPRIHRKGKTFLDMTGRNLSSGLSDSRFRKPKVPFLQDRTAGSGMPMSSDHFSVSRKSDSDELPLLIEPWESWGITESTACPCDYPVKLGNFPSHSLRQNHDYSCSSALKLRNQQNSRGRCNARHLSLTQKYMPNTFKDLIGQNLVIRALSNAAQRGKIGFLYVFYGPHGTGKTSCARVFARALNCKSAEHPKPCGLCISCTQHNMGKHRNVQEMGPVDNFDFECIIDILDSMNMSLLSSQYRVLIIDDCDALPPDSWRAILKVIDIAPRNVVFILVSTSLDHLPHIIISRCHKFFFPKLKDVDIINALQRIAKKEGLKIDKGALKLIASHSDGSLTDAEMTLDQLSLLGQEISESLVQKLVGLVSDEKLVDLLDLALSADTMNTVKNLREIVNAGVEPLVLMSQLATVITDILAGSYVFTDERLRKNIFRRPILSKEVLDKLRRALKTLSEAETQLRTSSDRLTWLTAALLQLAPDHQYMLPSASADSSFNHGPMPLNYTAEIDVTWKDSHEQAGMPNSERDPSSIRIDHLGPENAEDDIINFNYYDRKKCVLPPQASSSLDITRANEGQISCMSCKEIEGIWLAVLEKIQLNRLKKFMCQEGKLLSVSSGADPVVQLIFSSYGSKSKVEKFRGHILQAFESVLGSPLIVNISYESKKEVEADVKVPLVFQASESGSAASAQMITKPESFTTNYRMSKPRSGNYITRLSRNILKGAGPIQARCLHSDSLQISKSENDEMEASQECECNKHTGNFPELDDRGSESVWVEKATSVNQKSALVPDLEKRKFDEQSQNRSIVRRKVSLGHIIQHARGYTLKSGWSRPKVMSTSQKIEQANLGLDLGPRSRSLLCWKVFRIPHGKIPYFRIRARKPRFLLKLIPCARLFC